MTDGVLGAGRLRRWRVAAARAADFRLEVAVRARPDAFLAPGFRAADVRPAFAVAALGTAFFRVAGFLRVAAAVLREAALLPAALRAAVFVFTAGRFAACFLVVFRATRTSFAPACMPGAAPATRATAPSSPIEQPQGPASHTPTPPSPAIT